MNKHSILLSIAALAGLALASGAFTGRGLVLIEEDSVPPALPSDAVGVREVISARPYVLEVPYTHRWRAEAPKTAAGYLLVLDVAGPFTTPRGTLESVLYVGDQTAERINWGTGSGRVVALVPSAVDESGAPALDLDAALMFYGTPALPEEVDAAQIAEELEGAVAAGVRPLPVERALREGGSLLRLEDRTALTRHAATLVLEHSPAESDLARGILVPLLR